MAKRESLAEAWRRRTGLKSIGKPVAVVHGTDIIGRYDTIAEAEAVIHGLAAVDPAGVHNGDYSIDAPELMVNPPKVPAPRLSVSQLGTLQVLLTAYERELREGTFYDSAQDARDLLECVTQDVLERTSTR